MSELEQIAQILKERIDKHQSGGRTLTLKVKFSDYQQITRSRTLDFPIKDLSVIITEAKALFKSIELDNRNIRLLGLALSNLDNAQTSQIIQLSLFTF